MFGLRRGMRADRRPVEKVLSLEALDGRIVPGGGGARGRVRELFTQGHTEQLIMRLGQFNGPGRLGGGGKAFLNRVTNVAARNDAGGTSSQTAGDTGQPAPNLRLGQFSGPGRIGGGGGMFLNRPF